MKYEMLRKVSKGIVFQCIITVMVLSLCCGISYASERCSIQNPYNGSVVKGVIEIRGKVDLYEGEHFEVKLSGGQSKILSEHIADISVEDSYKDVPNGGIIARIDTNAYPDRPDVYYTWVLRYFITVQIVDASGNVREDDCVYISFNNTSEAPQLPDIKEILTPIDMPTSCMIAVYDPDDFRVAEGKVTMSCENLPAGATFDPNTGLFSWTRPKGDKKVYKNVIFTAKDDIHTRSISVNLTPVAVTKVKEDVFSPEMIFDDNFLYFNSRQFGYNGLYRYNYMSSELHSLLYQPDIEHICMQFGVYENTLTFAKLKSGGSSSIIKCSLSDPAATQSTIVPEDTDTRMGTSIYDGKIAWLVTGIYDRKKSEGLYMYEPSVTEPVKKLASFPVNNRKGNTCIWKNIIVWSNTEDFSNERIVGIYRYTLPNGPVEELDKAVTGIASDKNKVYWIRHNMVMCEYDMETGQLREKSMDIPNSKYHICRLSRFAYEGQVGFSSDIYNVAGSAYAYVYNFNSGRLNMLGTRVDVDIEPVMYKDKLAWADSENNLFLGDVLSEPQILSLSATELIAGQTVTINGKGFGYNQGSGDNVVFANNTTAIIKSWQDDKIECVVPEGACSGPIKIVNAAGESNGVSITVAKPNSIPVSSYTIPASVVSTGKQVTITTKYSDDDGAGNIGICYLLIYKADPITGNVWSDGAHLFYNLPYRTAYTYGDNGPWSSATSNSQVKIISVVPRFSLIDNKVVELDWTLEFSDTFGGTHVINTGVVDNYCGVSFANPGTININYSPKATMPPTSGRGVWTNITATYTDKDGAGDLSNCAIMISPRVPNYNNYCVAYYDVNTNKLELLQVNGSGPVQSASTQYVGHQYVILDRNNTNNRLVKKVGNKITITWRIYLNSTIFDQGGGVNLIYLQSRDKKGADSGVWKWFGGWKRW